MLTNISYYQLLGIPVLMYLGIVGIILLFTAAAIGGLSISGKIKISAKTHKLIAGVGLFFSLIHGLLAILARL